MLKRSQNMVQSHISGQTQSSEFIKRNAKLSVFTISLFRSLLVSETQRITKVCNEWEEKLVANAHLISEVKVVKKTVKKRILSVSKPKTKTAVGASSGLR